MGSLFTRIYINNRNKFFYFFGILFVIFSIIIALFLGTVAITVPDILRIVTEHLTGIPLYKGPKSTEMIIWEIRFSRVVLAFFVGAALSLAGAAFQGLLRNPLADPYTIGVSSGASLGAVLVIFFQLNIIWLNGFTLPVFAIAGGGLTLLLVFGITRLASSTLANETIILAGVILSSFTGALVSLLMALTPREDVRQILYWLMGSVSMRGWEHVKLIIPFFVIGAVILLLHAKELNGLALGDQSAQFTGINVKKKKRLILIAASILTGGAVAVSGAVGFVGLVIPHLVRLISGANHKHVLPLTLFIGGGYLVLADLAARTIISPRELPIGVVTALIGAPIFTMLLIKERMRRGGI
ncbi:iron complex transport system permease protein [Peribacillus deserti]|uniref:Iron complex transport system permease protein n=1 Tax=Peribacillus deserti TaxID=673318 RepID=A0ABS2QMI6_9BACI|nr:iron ABC transporter permease [Peribacillus deserti]MBM7694386.1 iron complex transport system permease protein [Peribacillus deserti]